MGWLDDKAQAGLELVRWARKEQLYPHFRPFETGGLHTSIGGKSMEESTSIMVNFALNTFLQEKEKIREIFSNLKLIKALYLWPFSYFYELSTWMTLRKFLQNNNSKFVCFITLITCKHCTLKKNLTMSFNIC